MSARWIATLYGTNWSLQKVPKGKSASSAQNTGEVVPFNITVPVLSPGAFLWRIRLACSKTLFSWEEMLRPKALQGQHMQEGTAKVRVNKLLFWARFFPSCVSGKKGTLAQLEASRAALCLGSTTEETRSAQNIHIVHYRFPEYPNNDHLHSAPCSLPTDWWNCCQLIFGHYRAPTSFQHITTHNTSQVFFHSRKIQIIPHHIRFQHFTCHFKILHHLESPLQLLGVNSSQKVIKHY